MNLSDKLLFFLINKISTYFRNNNGQLKNTHKHLSISQQTHPLINSISVIKNNMEATRLHFFHFA